LLATKTIPPPKNAPLPTLAPRRCLIVADSPFQAPYLARSLSRAGAATVIVDSLDSGLDALSGAAFDAVLADRALAAELAQKKYHLVLANIVADVIIPLAPQVPGLLEEDGVFLCSGIIDTRTHEVEEALKRAALTLIQKREKNGWAALEARV